MRRLLALTALIAMTWPHVMVTQCAAMEPTSPASTTASVVAEHSHVGPDCPALMACSSLMAEGAPAEMVTDAVAPSHAVARAAPLSPTGAVLAAEPPPPRRPA